MRKNVAPYVGCVDVTQDTTGRFYVGRRILTFVKILFKESEAAHEESSIVQNHGVSFPRETLTEDIYSNNHRRVTCQSRRT